MEDHLRAGVCFWTPSLDGRDMFGSARSTGPAHPAADPMERPGRSWPPPSSPSPARSAVVLLHDRDVAPEGASFAEFRDNLDALADEAAAYQEETGVRLLGTANLFSSPARCGTCHMCTGCRVGEDLGVGVGCRAGLVAGMREEVRRAPQEADAGLLLVGCGLVGERVQVVAELGEGGALGAMSRSWKQYHGSPSL